MPKPASFSAMKIFAFTYNVNVFLLLFLMLIFYSCDKQKVQIPSYLEIESVNLVVTDPFQQGTASHKITDAWVYVNDNLQGIYELPATFPVLAQGRNSLKIRAGIKDNGISIIRTEYPFFDFYTSNSFQFYPDSILRVKPVVQYSSGVKIPWIEDFESPGFTIDSVVPSFSKISRVTNNVFEGNASGYISLDASRSIFKGKSSTAFNLPKGGAEVYLELNYYATTNFNILLASNKLSGTVEDLALIIAPTNKTGTAVWNKIYVNLTGLVSGNPDGMNYHIVFYAGLQESDLSSAEIYLDNIKLVHF